MFVVIYFNSNNDFPSLINSYTYIKWTKILSKMSDVKIFVFKSIYVVKYSNKYLKLFIAAEGLNK